MGRPLNFDRERALEAAMNEIWKHGVEASSVKALAEHLGISRSSFYNSFGSREELLQEILELYFSSTPDRMLDEVDAESGILSLITRFFRLVCHIRAADPKGCLAVNCIAELVGVDDVVGPKLVEAIQQSVDRFERLLRRAAGNHEISASGDLRAKALALQNLLIGISLMSKMVRSEEELWAVVRVTLEGLGLYQE